jgi:hypothetical protein
LRCLTRIESIRRTTPEGTRPFTSEEINMAGRGPQTFKKRQKEQKRKEKQEEKRAKRLQRNQGLLPGEEPAEEEEMEPLTEPAPIDPWPEGDVMPGL